jgi:hypothetical protein
MSRKRLRSAVFARGISRRLLIVAALVVVAVGIARVSGGASGNPASAVSHPSAGIARSGSSATASASSSTATGTATATATSFGPNVGSGVYNGKSPAVSELPLLPVPPTTSITARDNENLHPTTTSSNAKDPVVQKSKGTGPISNPISNFDGICLPFGPPCDQASSCSCLPPDTNGEVGATQYVQTVNSDFAVYSKTGSVLRGATPINQLWAGTDSECANHNDGDPVVVYDQLAKRWLVSEFIALPKSGEQYGECIAVSTTSDATGSYYLYTFLFGSDTFYDYPKIGVWPDGYYMTANEFPTVGVTSSGAGAFVFERSQMLQGLPARYVYFDEAAHNPPGAQYIGQLPGDLEGSTLPPAGQPNLFAEVDDPSTIPTDAGFYMRFWKFHVDWTNPANSTFGNNGEPNYKLPVAAFVRPQCVYGYGPNCVPQKGGPQGLDVLGDRLMFRMPIRNFGRYESVALNHTVVANGTDGIRWYEVRIPKGGDPNVYQQGTYAPADSATNPLYRWMGSVAMDKSGDLALGYSASGPNDYPSVRYTGRAATDPLAQLAQAEKVAFTGTGPQTEAEGRWGDYSDLTVDPTNDCTFFYTTEYLAPDTVVIGTWRTRVVSFRFPGCK